MRKIKMTLGACALAITVAMSSMTMGVVCAADGDDTQVVDVQDQADNTANDDASNDDSADTTDADSNDDANDDANDDNTDDADADDSVNAGVDDSDANLQDVTVYITDNMDNDRSGDSIVLAIDGNDDSTRRFKLVINGGYFTRIYDNDCSIKDGEDLTDWCNGTLSDGLSLTKYTGNFGADYGRVSIDGTTSDVGNHNVVITIPKNRVTAYNNFKVSEDGLTVTFTVNVNGISTTYTAPVANVVFEASDDEEVATPKDSDYVVFCKETANAIRNAGIGQTLEIKTTQWISFNDLVSDALEARPDVALTLQFVYNEQTYVTAISAGTIRETTTQIIAADSDDPNAVDTVIDPALNEDGNHYYGFMYLSSVYGASELN